MPDTTVLEFARRPVPGKVKTRLARTEGEREAARIYRLLATDVHATLMRAQRHGAFDVALCLPPEDVEEPWLEGAARVFSQGEGDLGDRLTRCFTQAFDGGARRAFAVGTDVVGLDDARLREAVALLDDADVVLAPTPDGGYGLLGIRPNGDARWQALFEDVPWSTRDVAERTRALAANAGLRVRELRGLRDVDVAHDLRGVVPLISILMPVLDDAAALRANLPRIAAQAARAKDAELIVCDGGSSDDSASIAEGLGARVVRAPPGRGRQLRAAAGASRGRWLWTLHADTALADDALDRALRFATRRTHDWAFCELRVDHPAPSMRFLECLIHGRSRIFGLPYGDQGILVRRRAYRRVAGYDDVPLMEDVLLARRLSRTSGPGVVGTRLGVDARRWRRHGVGGTTLRNAAALFRFFVLGTPPEVLARSYRRG